MPNELQMLAFEFEATIETNPERNSQTEKPDPESEAVENLNKYSDDIAQELQKEIKRLFRSSVTVQADLTFHEGSIIVTGTIIIMSWLGPIALAGVKKTIETEFSRVIGVVTKRILQRAVRRWAPRLNAVVGNIEMNPQATSSTAESGRTGVQSSNLLLLTAANTVLLLVVLIIQLILVFKPLRL